MVDGATAASISPASGTIKTRRIMIDSSLDYSADAPVGGWLLVLALMLLGWQPVSLAFSASNLLDALPIRGLPLALVLAARIGVVGLGIAAGIAILRKASGSLGMARAALTASAGLDLFVYVTPYVPSNRMPGDTPFYVAFTLVYYAAWMLYLARSRRVRQTLG
jgi:hypothetical protein